LAGKYSTIFGFVQGFWFHSALIFARMRIATGGKLLNGDLAARMWSRAPVAQAFRNNSFFSRLRLNHNPEES
jgi:hypothetical protein